MKKSIKLNFVDFWDGFVPEDNFIFNILKEKYDVHLSSDPDYLFYSVFGTDNLRYDCIKIFYTGENQAPDFNVTDYAIGFDRLVFGDRYLRFPFYALYTGDFRMMMEKHHFTAGDLAAKESFCSFVYSNNNASPERGLMLEALDKYKTVSSGGRYLNNVGGPVADKNAFQTKHKFSIAFENCSHPGYTTEKLIQAFAAKTVPIYWGDPTVEETFNRDAFVNAMGFNTFEEVVDEVRRIDGDDDLYLKMMQAPALLHPDTDSREAVFGRLSDFLSNIIDQPLEMARRYSRSYWGKRYMQKCRMLDRAYRMSPRGVSEMLYKRTLWTWRRNGRMLWKLDRLMKGRAKD